MIVDFHCHTFYSKDSITRIEPLLRSARGRGLDRLVITDHNTIKGALAAKKRSPDFVIVGEEIKTTYGELLAVYVKEEVPPGLEPLEAIRRLKEQGAFISVSHPMDPFRSDWPLEVLEQIAPLVDAIETHNARALWPSMNSDAERFAWAHHLSGTAGSDAHDPFEVGRMALDLPEFDDADGLRAALGQAKLVGRISPFWVHGFSVRAKWVKRLKIHY